MILHTMTEIQKAGFALFLNRRHLSTHDEVHRIEVVWCAMRKNWQGLALKLMRWIEGRSLCSAILCFIDSILSDVSFQHLHCFIDSQMSVFNISIDVNVSNFKFTQHSEVSCDSVSSWCKLPPVALVQGTSSSMHSCQGKSPKCATWLRCADAHSQPSARCIARINLACSSCLANINIVLFCVSSQHPA